LAAGVQHGQHDLQARLLELGVRIDGDAAAVVVDGDGVAGFVQGDVHAVGVAVEVLIDGVIDDLPEEVVQALGVHAADVHRRALADRLQALQGGEVGGSVFGRCGGGAHVQLTQSFNKVRSSASTCFITAGDSSPSRRTKSRWWSVD